MDINKRMPKFIKVGIGIYKVKRVKKDLYAIYTDNGNFSDKFHGYADKNQIMDSIHFGKWV